MQPLLSTEIPEMKKQETKQKNNSRKFVLANMQLKKLGYFTKSIIYTWLTDNLQSCFLRYQSAISNISSLHVSSCFNE